MFTMSMNLDEMPAGVSQFEGRGILYSSRLLTQLSHGYFGYRATPEFFGQFETHAQPNQERDMGGPIHPGPCDQLPRDLSLWRIDGFSGTLTLTGKMCYYGTYTSFSHYLVYDPITTDVWHFMKGTAD